MRCDECLRDDVLDKDLAFDNKHIPPFFLCRTCYINYYLQKLGKHMMKIPGAKEAMIIQAADAMFEQQRRLNPPPDIQKTEMAETLP